MARKGPISIRDIINSLQNKNKPNAVEYSQPTGNMKRSEDYGKDKQ